MEHWLGAEQTNGLRISVHSAEMEELIMVVCSVQRGWSDSELETLSLNLVCWSWDVPFPQQEDERGPWALLPPLKYLFLCHSLATWWVKHICHSFDLNVVLTWHNFRRIAFLFCCNADHFFQKSLFTDVLTNCGSISWWWVISSALSSCCRLKPE